MNRDSDSDRTYKAQSRDKATAGAKANTRDSTRSGLCGLLCFVGTHLRKTDDLDTRCDNTAQKTIQTKRTGYTTHLSDKLQTSTDSVVDTLNIPHIVNGTAHGTNTDKLHGDDVLRHATLKVHTAHMDNNMSSEDSNHNTAMDQPTGCPALLAASLPESVRENGEVNLQIELISPDSPTETPVALVSESTTGHNQSSSVQTKSEHDNPQICLLSAGLQPDMPRRVSLTPDMIEPLQLTPGAMLDNDGFTYRLTFASCHETKPDREPSVSPSDSVIHQPVILGLPEAQPISAQLPEASTLEAANNTDIPQRTRRLSTRRDTLLELALNYVKSPDGRYIKLDEEVGRGSFKTVYKGLDCETGVNVAWCELMDTGRNNRAYRQKFKEEVEMLKGLRHDNILRFYDSWEYNKKTVLVTELMTAGTLKLYIKRFRKISVKLMANWCRQILKGLVFLHTRTPPVLHRDLKCDNFFINGQTGRVKIGDLGLAILKPQSYARTVIGTPEFMAPEMYEEHYDESVDVYAFGMCMLEMATSEYPYKECTNPGQIYKRVTKGIKPHSFERIENRDVQDIIDKCIRAEPKDRMTAGELLALDFFNEWSVHLDCSWTNRHNILQFRIRDDVIRNNRKEGEAIQFDYNLNTDEPERMAVELVNNGYLEEGNVKVAVRLIRQKIAHFVQQKRNRTISMNHEAQLAARRASSDSVDSRSTDVEGLLDTPRDRSDSTESQASTEQQLYSAENKRRRNSSTNNPAKDLEALKQQRSKRKALQILIEDISRKEEGSTLVTCQLQSGKATVTFTFNSNVDSPEDICENLAEYVTDSGQFVKAKEQIMFIFDLVKTHKDQPDIAKKICQQKHHIPDGSITPVHSRSSSKDLYAFDVFSDNLMPAQLPLQRSISREDKSPSIEGIDQPPCFPLTTEDRKPPASPAKELDNTWFRDRSGTWSVNASPARSTSLTEEKIRKSSIPSTYEKKLASRPTQLAMGGLSRQDNQKQHGISEEASTPNLDHGFMSDKNDDNMRTQLQSKKSTDITELSKSIEKIMSRYDRVGNTISSADRLPDRLPTGAAVTPHTLPTSTNYVSRSLASSPVVRRKFQTRQLSSTSRTDGGDLISPNDSLGTNSTTFSNPTFDGNSLTADSGIYAILPKTVRSNSICEPIATITKKVGRFQIGKVKERTESVGTGSPEYTVLPALTLPPETASLSTVPVSISPDACIEEVTSLLARISERSQQNSPTSPCNQCQLDSDLENDALLQQIKLRQASERRELEERQMYEIEVYKTGKKALQLYSERCNSCAEQQIKSGNSTVLCDVHTVAKHLQELATNNSSSSSSVDHKGLINTPRGQHVTDETDGLSDHHDNVDYVSSFLRNGKHYNSEVGKVRRIRHNSVEMILYRLMSTDSDSTDNTVGNTTPHTIEEENDDVISELNNVDNTFKYPHIDTSRIADLGTDPDRMRVIQEEVTKSHQAVLAGLRNHSDRKRYDESMTDNSADTDHAVSRQVVVKLALHESQAQLLKSLQNTLKLK